MRMTVVKNIVFHIQTEEEYSWTKFNKDGQANANRMWRKVDDFMESVFTPLYCDGYMAVTG